MTIIRYFGHILSAYLGAMMASAFGLGLIALTLAMITPDFPIIREAFASARCFAGVPAEDSPCFDDQIEVERQARLEAERARRVAEAALRAAQDASSGQDLVFVQGDQIADRISLVVGTIYRDENGQAKIVRAFCYANLDHGGLDPRVLLSVMDERGFVSTMPITNGDLVMLEITRADLDEARAQCAFPDPS